MKKTTLLIGVCLFGLVVCAQLAGAQWFLFKNPILGAEAKEFTLRDLSGQRHSLSAIRQGNPAIVFFWATWCPHCVTQFPDLKARAEEFARNNIRLILVDLGEDAQRIRNFMNRRGLEFDVLIDSDGAVAADYGVQGVPTYVLISGDGIVRAVEHAFPADYERLLLGEQRGQ